ncbi:MAG: HAD family phosphatase [Candidatus Omnitrophota bacterium]
MRSLKNRPKAILFDMDGVVVDSMPYHFISWYEALRPYGVRASCFEIYQREGELWEHSLKDFLSRCKTKPTKKVFHRIFLARKSIFRKYFKQFIFPGAREFLACLKNKGYLLGLVTGTPRREVNHILTPNIRKLFDQIVSGDMVKRGKPHPEPYLLALKLLGLESKEAVAVENAPLGIESVKRAGMFCIALTTSLPKEYLKRADMIVDNLEEITGLIEKTCKF